jgi:hypothetical protein
VNRFSARVALAASLLPLACGGAPWGATGAPDVPPDEQFRTGVEAGSDVYVWHCYRGSRVVVRQFGTACTGTRAPVVERGACGAPLPVEATFSVLDREGGAPTVPRDRRWPGSADAGP